MYRIVSCTLPRLMFRRGTKRTFHLKNLVKKFIKKNNDKIGCEFLFPCGIMRLGKKTNAC
jgi:hypothetical protein